jgi:hypothetical protein
MEVLGDEQTRQWKARLGEDPALLYPQLAGVRKGSRVDRHDGPWCPGSLRGARGRAA